MNRLLLALICLALMLAGCGGAGTSSAPAATVPPSSTPPPSGGSGPLPGPAIITVNGAASGVDIAVAPPSGTAPNATSLGVAPLGNPGGSASDTGDQIHRGATMQVLMFGPGLSATMQVRLSGPQDYTISNISSIMSTDNTPGIEFDLAVNSNAALGGRTVILTDSRNNVTTFTGGLEVLP